jgi:hypothetical protein
VARDIRAIHADRLAERARADARLTRRLDRISAARLGVFVLGAALVWPVARGMLAAWWLALPLVAFLGLVLAHQQARALARLLRGSMEFYRRALARIDERWAGAGTPGDRFRDPNHPFVDDLDLFGRGSLFELLCTCRTRPGEARLASWLAAPAEPSEVRARQEAAAELGRAIDLREDLARLGEDASSALDAERVVAWATAPPVLRSPVLRVLAAALGVAAAASLAAWALGAGPAWLVLTMVLELPVHAMALARSQRVLAAVDEPVRELVLAAALLERVCAEPLTSPKLIALANAVGRGAGSPIRAIHRLRRFVDLVDAQRNPLFAPLALATLWPIQMGFAIEAWRRRHGRAVAGWLDALAELEALVAIGTYTAEHPDDVTPTFADTGPLVDATALGHPLLPATRVVRNDLRLDDATRVLVVSGSNMSGKSTMLRTVGVNVVLAQMGAPVRATRLRLSPLAIGASIRTLDSLQNGTSRFYAEITRLRQLVALAEGPRPLLFLLDEILHGTNSHDRAIGAEAVVRGLVRRGAAGIVTTHDLALASIAQDPSARARNVHFEDHVEGDRMVFDYRMRDGVVTHSNALALMRAVGLEV